MQTLFIDVLGVSIKVETDCPYAFENLRKDFGLYEKDTHTSPQVLLSVLKQDPPYQRVPPIDASLQAPGLICYKEKTINYITYSNDGLLIYDFATEKGELFGKEDFFLYEKTKMTILSRLGELLDQEGIHRLHGFGVCLNEKSLICLLPMEGGKTTTTLNLIKAAPNLKMIADDICLINHEGIIHPFLLRIGARDKSLIEGIPGNYINEIVRPYYGVKYFIDPLYFQQRLAPSRKLDYILIGKRCFRQQTSIEKVSKLTCMGVMIESGVFGVGLPQLLEFFIRGDFRLFLQRTGVIASRIVFCLTLLFKTNTFIIKIGLDKKDTTDKILEFLQ